MPTLPGTHGGCPQGFGNPHDVRRLLTSARIVSQSVHDSLLTVDRYPKTTTVTLERPLPPPKPLPFKEPREPYVHPACSTSQRLREPMAPDLTILDKEARPSLPTEPSLAEPRSRRCSGRRHGRALSIHLSIDHWTPSITQAI
jgi:hypothetical protein